MRFKTSLQCICCITIPLIVVASVLLHEKSGWPVSCLCESFMFVRNMTDMEGVVRVGDHSSGSRKRQKGVVKRNIEQMER